MKVLLAVNFSQVSERTVRSCAERAWPPNTVLRVLGIVDKIPPSAAELWYDAAGDLDAVWLARKKLVEEIVQEAAEVLRHKGLSVETAVMVGRRRRTIAVETRLWSADIVINGAQGMPGITEVGLPTT